MQSTYLFPTIITRVYMKPLGGAILGHLVYLAAYSPYINCQASDWCHIPQMDMLAELHIDAATLARLDLIGTAFGLLQVRNDRRHGTMRRLLAPLDCRTLRQHLDDGRLPIIPVGTPPLERQRLLRYATYLRAATQKSPRWLARHSTFHSATMRPLTAPGGNETDVV